MNININSWHYKLHGKIGWNIPNNLCSYFWKTLSIAPLAIILCAVAITIGPFIWARETGADIMKKHRYKVRKREDSLIQENEISASIKVKRFVATHSTKLAVLVYLSMFGVTFNFFHGLSFPPETSALGALGVSIFFGVLISLPIFLGFFATIFGGAEGIENFIKRYKQPVPDDLLDSYIKSVKNKVCPLVNFVEE